MSTIFNGRIATIAANARLAMGSGGFSFPKLFQVLELALIEAMEAAADTLENDGATKKQAVLDAIGKIYDGLAGMIPMPWSMILSLVQARSIVLWFADGAIEAIYSKFKERFSG